MGQVAFDMSVSLDGYIAGPDENDDQPLGANGDRLHDWISSSGESSDDGVVLTELFQSTGAVLAGRRTFDMSDGPNGWGDGPLGEEVPVFVVTHQAPVRNKAGGAEFTFVTEGIEIALKQAQDAAGDKNVYVMGGADLARQYVEAGLLDQIQLHIAPVLLGAGRRLFDALGTDPVELVVSRVISTPHATHIRYQLVR
jgi:dihydrofolate reductase